MNEFFNSEFAILGWILFLLLILITGFGLIIYSILKGRQFCLTNKKILIIGLVLVLCSIYFLKTGVIHKAMPDVEGEASPVIHKDQK